MRKIIEIKPNLYLIIIHNKKGKEVKIIDNGKSLHFDIYDFSSICQNFQKEQ